MAEIFLVPAKTLGDDRKWNKDVVPNVPCLEIEKPAPSNVNQSLGDGEMGDDQLLTQATSASVSFVPENRIIQANQVIGHGRVVAMAYVVLGIEYLLPWTILAADIQFFTDFKLQWVSVTYIRNHMAKLKRLYEYREFFTNYVQILWQFPFFSGIVINLFFSSESGFRQNVLKWSFIMTCCQFAFILLALMDSRKWPEENFFFICILVLVKGLACGNLTSFIWASSSYFTGLEMFIFLGSSIAGLLTALVNFIFKLVSGAVTQSELKADRYTHKAFTIHFTHLVICCISSVMFGSLRYNLYYRTIYCDTEKRDAGEKYFKEEIRKLKLIFKKTWRLQINMVYLLIITITSYSSLQIGIKPQPSFPWPFYYQDITIFLTFNVCSLIGNLVSVKVKCPGPSRVWIPVALRTLFIPILLFCNYKPDVRRMPVLFHHDSIHSVVSALNGFTTGYFMIILSEQIAKKCSAENLDMSKAMKLCIFCVDGGVLCGVLLGLLLDKLATI